MNNLNSVLIERNLVGEPLFYTTPRGTAICAFTIMSYRFLRQGIGIEKEGSYFDVEAEGELTKPIRRLGGKGRGVRIVGQIKQTRWNDKEGKDHSKVIIVVEHIESRLCLDDPASSSP